MNNTQSKSTTIDAAEKQSLLAVLQFLKKKNLKVKFYKSILNTSIPAYTHEFLLAYLKRCDSHLKLI